MAGSQTERKQTKYIIGPANDSSKADERIEPGKAGALRPVREGSIAIMSLVDGIDFMTMRHKGDGIYGHGSVMRMPLQVPVDLLEGEFAIVFNRGEAPVAKTVFTPQDAENSE